MDARKHEVVMARQATRRISCAWCDAEIVQVRSDQRFCSAKCADTWHNERTRVRTLRAKKAVPRFCEECGGQISANRSMQAIYCSPECTTLAQATTTPKKSRVTGDYNREYLYGLTPEQYAVMLADQEDRCAICRVDLPGGKGGWHVDHDHGTGRIRGLLCHRCNLGLGNFQDDANRLQAAYDYLMRGTV
jgi:predicted nucleic acid-binding Zn ribbon protein